MNRISRDSDLRKFFVHLTFIFTHISLIYLNSYNTKTNCKHPTLILWSSSTSWAVKGIRPASEKKPKQLRDSIITGDPITVSDRSYLMTVEAFLTDTSRGCPALSLHLGYHWSLPSIQLLPNKRHYWTVSFLTTGSVSSNCPVSLSARRHSIIIYRMSCADFLRSLHFPNCVPQTSLAK